MRQCISSQGKISITTCATLKAVTTIQLICLKALTQAGSLTLEASSNKSPNCLNGHLNLPCKILPSVSNSLTKLCSEIKNADDYIEQLLALNAKRR